jgi:hypothetical protein
MIPLSVCASVLCASISPVFAKSACYTPTEISAVQLRQLQIEIMVSTLRCDSSTYDFRARYSAFMERVNPLMPENAKHLRTIVGKHGKGNFDQYLTSMSNDAQNISQQDPLYCTTAVQLIEQIASHDTKDVPSIAAQAIPSPYEVVACPEKPAPAPKAKQHKKSS